MRLGVTFTIALRLFHLKSIVCFTDPCRWLLATTKSCTTSSSTYMRGASSLMSTFETHNDAPCASKVWWQGNVVVRLLPPRILGEMPRNFKPLRQSVDPTKIKGNCGPVCRYRKNQLQPAPLSASPAQSEEEETQPSRSTLDDTLYFEQTFYPAPASQSLPAGNESRARSIQGETTLVVYLNNLHHQSEKEHGETIVINLNRDSNEEVAKTLERMRLSLRKKLGYSGGNKKQQKKKNKKQKSTNKPKTETNELSTTASIWKVDPQSNALLEKLDDQRTNRDIWEEAISTPLVIQFKISSDGDDSDKQQIEQIRLLVDSCPPTITAVRTFEGFSGHLFEGVPTTIQTQCLFADHCSIDWYVSSNACNDAPVTRVAVDTPTYVPRDVDIDKFVFILCTPMRRRQQHHEADAPFIFTPCNGHGCEEAYQFELPVQKRPTNTLLQLRPAWTRSRVGADQDCHLRVMTYNILADQNVFSNTKRESFYPYVSAETLKRERRMPLILHEILAYQADIICLQEVDHDVFENLFLPVLEQFSYQGYYSCKVNSGAREGCAMFWSTKRFHSVAMEDQKSYALRDLFPGHEDSIVRDNQDSSWRESNDAVVALLQRRRDLRDAIMSHLGHVVQMVPLEIKDSSDSTKEVPPKTLWVANTHLYFHGRANHIRLMQMYVLLWQLDKELANKNSPAAVVLCGDFNSKLQSALGQLVLERYVPTNFRYLQQDLCDFKYGMENGDPPDNIPRQGADDFPSLRIPAADETHLPPLQSVYLETPPTFTHHVLGFSGALDHILMGPAINSNLYKTTVKTAPMPTVLDVTSDAVAMPSERLPSDHVSLVCDLSIGWLTGKLSIGTG